MIGLGDLRAELAVVLAWWYPGLAYRPGPTLARFIGSDERRLLLRAPNQVGKTLAGAKRADAWSLAHPGQVLGVLVPDLANHYPELCAKIARVITEPELDPATTYAEGRGYTVHGRHGIRYRNGARWLFRSGSGGLQGLEGFSANAGWCDEVPERGHWGAFTRGVHGPLWVTMTPIGRDPRWFRRRVEGDADTGAPAEEPGWTQYVPALSLEECPWLDADDLEERRRKTDPYEAAQRLRGEWDGPTADRRLTAMSSEAVLDAMPTGDWRVVVTMDHGEGAGHEHVLLVLWDSERVVIADEYVNATPTNADEDAAGILAMLARNRVSWHQVDRWVGDVNSAGKLGPGSSVNDALRAAITRRVGVPVAGWPSIATAAKGPGSVERGERLLNLALASGELRIHRRAARTIRAMWSYTGGDSDSTHAIDAMRYGVAPILTDRLRPSARRLYVGLE